MYNQKQEIITLECEGCPRLGSVTLSSECDGCINKRKFDVIRLKTNLFTKEYNSKRKLIGVTPFFIDVRLGKPKTTSTKLLNEYLLPTGAKVEILQDGDEIGHIYNLTIPESNITFEEIVEISKQLEKFEETNDTNNDFLKNWFLGYGILNHLLQDKKILEININPPGYKTPMRIIHADYDECVSNIYPSDDFLNLLATRLKILTGRPLNKAQPQLDGEIQVNNTKARVAAIIDPFSVFGPAYSIRVHREQPWTLPLFIKNKAVSPLFAGLMSFVITHGRSFLTAGPRGSGKTSLLGSLILEILPKYRIITIEDTQELPVNSYKELGYDLLPLKVRSALLKEGMEMPFDTGLRTSLRLGDSCLIIGEIRSKEAKVLYEAMRVGAMSNVVAGTIHADNPYGVFDRVVNDLDVPRGSFKVTDLIIIVNQIKDPTGLSRSRRVLSVTEVLKDWEHEPKFQDLLVYNPQTDTLEPTDFLMKGKSATLNQILGRTKGYRNYNDMLNDILLRSWAKEILVKLGTNEELEATFIARSNLIFTRLFNQFKPLESKKNMEEFKKEYTIELESYLKESRKQTHKFRKYKEDLIELENERDRKHKEDLVEKENQRKMKHEKDQKQTSLDQSKSNQSQSRQFKSSQSQSREFQSREFQSNQSQSNQSQSRQFKSSQSQSRFSANKTQQSLPQASSNNFDVNQRLSKKGLSKSNLSLAEKIFGVSDKKSNSSPKNQSTKNQTGKNKDYF